MCGRIYYYVEITYYHVFCRTCKIEAWKEKQSESIIAFCLINGVNVMAVQAVLFDEESVVDSASERVALYNVVFCFKGGE